MKTKILSSIFAFLFSVCGAPLCDADPLEQMGVEALSRNPELKARVINDLNQFEKDATDKRHTPYDRRRLLQGHLSRARLEINSNLPKSSEESGPSSFLENAVVGMIGPRITDRLDQIDAIVRTSFHCPKNSKPGSKLSCTENPSKLREATQITGAFKKELESN